MKRLAKLKSDISIFGDNIKVIVTDDEIKSENNNDTIVMWMDASIEQANDGVTHLFVPLVDYNNEVYYDMPKERQDSCATVLFKKFLSFYNKNYGRNTDNWMPVGAHFANYDLQEKFKLAIDKGIFPKESLKYCKFIEKDKWEDDPHYNKKNRDKLNDFMNNPGKFIKGFEIRNNCIINPVFSSLKDAVRQIKEQLSFVTKIDDSFFELSGVMENNEIFIELVFNRDPIQSDYSREDGFFLYNSQGEITFFNYSDIQKVKEMLLENKEIVRQCIDTNPQVMCFSHDSFYLNEIFDNNTAKSRRKRLVK